MSQVEDRGTEVTSLDHSEQPAKLDLRLRPVPGCVEDCFRQEGPCPH